MFLKFHGPSSVTSHPRNVTGDRSHTEKTPTFRDLDVSGPKYPVFRVVRGSPYSSAPFTSVRTTEGNKGLRCTKKENLYIVEYPQRPPLVKYELLL